MKIMICGKGGSGKSTLAALLAKNLARMGRPVLLVDADESNFGLSRLAGVETPEVLLENLGGRAGVREKMNQASDMNLIPIINRKFTVSDIPATCLSEVAGVKVLVMGKVKHFGEGCACMIGALTKRFLANLEEGPDTFVIVDTEAGVEHLGRGVDAGCGLILAVIDPTHESVLMADKLAGMAAQAGVPMRLVLNKADERIEAALRAKLPQDKIVAVLPNDDSIFLDSLEGRAISSQPLAVASLAEFVGSFSEKSSQPLPGFHPLG
ncbi:MAG: P-loop NTPase [Deltaproteobacteria bacterium]|nr:P-loop NTPase [Deltaproteobacteria bacterium]